MFLQKLEIQGFKSFATKSVLEFNRELTSIVGPNGSGKSNVVDAVRWVLGEQSLKVLRGKKMQDVIFAGSDQKSRLGFAEVSLYLNNEDNKAPIDYGEVVITRRVYRDGESEYLINKNKVRLQDVYLLMAKCNFGQNSYSIVGQGMVDSILTSSPQERKEFFDEATGVRQYQIKREQSLNKLERAYENLVQSQQLLQEIEPRLRSLTRQMKRLADKEELESELQKKQIIYYNFTHHGLVDELNQKKKEEKLISEQKKDLENKLIEWQQELEKIEEGMGPGTGFADLENKYQKSLTEKNKTLSEISLLQGKVDLQLTSTGQGNIVWLRKKEEELAMHLADLINIKKEAEQQLSKIEAQLQKKITEQEKVLSEFQNLKDQVVNQRQEWDDKKAQLALEKMATDYDDFLKAMKQINNIEELAALQGRAQKISEQINSLLKELGRSSKLSTQEQQDLEDKMDQFLVSKDNLVDEINQLRIAQGVARTKKEQADHNQRLVLEEKTKIDQEIILASDSSAADKKDLLQKQMQELKIRLSEQEATLQIAQEQLAEINARAEGRQANLIQMQRQTRDVQSELNVANNKMAGLQIEVAKLETRLEDLQREINEEMSDRWQVTELVEENINVEALRFEINGLKNKLSLIGGIDEGVANEYQEVKERNDFLQTQNSDLEHSIDSLQEVIQELDQKIAEQFNSTFDTINNEFQKYFKVLFAGGKANLVLRSTITNKDEKESEDSENAEEDNEEVISPIKKLKQSLTQTEIDIKACPPGKKIESLNTLSGGEKAMTAIALICAIISANPSPFVILDEVDAALDEANAGRYVAILNELSSKTQFIAITHNRVTMHHAAILYGVTMGTDSVSRLLSVNLKEAEEKYSN